MQIAKNAIKMWLILCIKTYINVNYYFGVYMFVKVLFS